ncbi:MAG: hypothetical protein WC722_11495 [Rhodospirillales bacterium]|jgi:hypothetical protein
MGDVTGFDWPALLALASAKGVIGEIAIDLLQAGEDGLFEGLAKRAEVAGQT